MSNTTIIDFNIVYSNTSETFVTSCDSYYWNDQLYTSTGEYSYSTINNSGCDSTAILILNISSSDTLFVIDTVCNSYFFDDTTFTQSGLYYLDNYTTVDGCDSTIILDLTISNISNILITYDASSSSECDGLVICETSGGIEPYNYNWNYFETSYVTQICSGINYLMIEDEFGCIFNDSVFVGPVYLGCTDYIACNFDSLANLDNGLCIYQDFYDCEGNCINDNDLDGVCDELEILGCTDSAAPNYNLMATEDDGSCIYCELSIDYLTNNTSSNYLCDGVIATLVNGNQSDYSIYINDILVSNYTENACYGFNTVSIITDLGCVFNDSLFVNSDVVFGCTDSLAINFLNEATYDDSSCLYFTPEIINISITDSINCYGDPECIKINFSNLYPNRSYSLLILSNENDQIVDTTEIIYLTNSDINNQYLNYCFEFNNDYIIELTENSILIDEILHSTSIWPGQIYYNVLANPFSKTELSCYGDNDGKIMLNVINGAMPLTYTIIGSNDYFSSLTSSENFVTFDNLPSDSYQILISDINSCNSNEQIIDINQPNQLIVNAFIQKEISCYGESDGILSCDINGGTGEYSFIWSHPNYPWVDDSQNNLQSLENMPFSVSADDIVDNPNYQSYSFPYTITVNDENGCESFSEVFLIEPEDINLIQTENISAYCTDLEQNNTGMIKVSASGGTPNQSNNYNFIWSNNQEEEGTHSSIENMNSGYYDVTVFDSRLCTKQLTVFIDLEPTWQEEISLTPISCFGSSDGSVSISMDGGCGDQDNSCGFNYEWNIVDSNTTIINDLQQGYYSVTVTDDFGCEGTYTLLVEEPSLLNFQITDLINQTCYTPASSSDDGSVIVDITGGSAPYNVTWSDTTSISSSAITNDELTITGLTAGEWLIEVEDANSCLGVFDLSSLHPNPFTIENGVEVTAEIDPQQFLLTDVIDCYGESNGEASVLNPNPNFIYSWYLENSNDLIDIGPSTSSLPAGNIIVKASYDSLCEFTSSSVTIDQNPPFELIYNNTIPAYCDNNIINISITGATPFTNQEQIADYNYNWISSILNNYSPINNDGLLEFDIPNIDTGIYVLQVYDKFGCDSTFEIDINDELINSDCFDCNLQVNPNPYIINSTTDISCDGSILLAIDNNDEDYTLYINDIENNYPIGNICYGLNYIYINTISGCTYFDTVFVNASEISGCIDSTADNYNSLANLDDGSCSYTLHPCDITPNGLFVDNIIHNRVRFNWSEPSSYPSHYMIRYRPVGNNSWTVMTAGPVNDNEFSGTSRTRYFMDPETTYEWNIRARVLNSDGSTDCQSPWSATSEYTTLPSCPNLENLSVSTEANWVTFSADAPGEEWGVWQSKAKIRELGTNSFRYANGDASGNINVLKGNFSASTSYEWHTKSWCTGNVDVDGNSDPQYHSGWGEFSSFITEEICDKLPINLSTSSNGANTAITMSWDLPLSGTPDHYFLELNNDITGQQWQWNNIAGEQTSKTKFNLSSGDYSWRIRGACGENGTSWATIFTQPEYYTLGGDRLGVSSVINDLEIYPNPSRDIFNVEFSTDEAQEVEIIVVNSIGQEIFNERVEVDGQYIKQIDLSNYSKGIYNLSIKTFVETISHRIILQ